MNSTRRPNLQLSLGWDETTSVGYLDQLKRLAGETFFPGHHRVDSHLERQGKGFYRNLEVGGGFRLNGTQWGCFWSGFWKKGG